MIEHVVLNAFMIYGLKLAMEPGMILYPVVSPVYKLFDILYSKNRLRLLNLLDKVSKPLFSCVYCMSSVWGFLYWKVQIDSNLLNLILHILCVAGLVYVIAKQLGLTSDE
jgi:hypothetical protein